MICGGLGLWTMCRRAHGQSAATAAADGATVERIRPPLLG